MVNALIFCSASSSIDPKFNDEAARVVGLLGRKGYGLVSGGTTKGTMKVIADAARDAGMSNIGVLPHFMSEVCYPDLTELVLTDTMSERKEKMREYAPCLAIALPGGIGTLDELFETLTLAKLGKYTGKILAYNMDGFYDSVRDLLDQYVADGMLEEENRARIAFPSTLEELERMI